MLIEYFWLDTIGSTSGNRKRRRPPRSQEDQGDTEVASGRRPKRDSRARGMARQSFNNEPTTKHAVSETCDKLSAKDLRSSREKKTNVNGISLKSHEALSNSACETKKNGIDTDDIVSTPLRNFPISSNELVRILIRSLHDLGYSTVSELLEKESGCKKENPNVEVLLDYVKQGEWERVLLALSQLSKDLEGTGVESNPRALQTCMMLVHREAFIEFLEDGNLTEAISSLQRFASLCTTLNRQTSEIELLSALLLCSGKHDVIKKLNGRSIDRRNNRSSLCDEILNFMPGSLYVRPRRLLELLDHAIVEQIRAGRLGAPIKTSLLNQEFISLAVDSVCGDPTSASGCLPSRVIQTIQLDKNYPEEVWICQFSNMGHFIAAATGKNIVLYSVDLSKNPCTEADSALVKEEDDGPLSPLQDKMCSKSMIFCFAWSPDDQFLVWGEDSGEICIWEAGVSFESQSAVDDTMNGNTNRSKIKSCSVHTNRVTSVVWMDSNRFFSGSFDSCIHLYDSSLRLLCSWSGSPVYDLFYSQKKNILVASCEGPELFRLFEVRNVASSGVVLDLNGEDHSSFATENGNSESPHRIFPADFVVNGENQNSNGYDNGIQDSILYGATLTFHELDSSFPQSTTHGVVVSLSGDPKGDVFVAQYSDFDSLVEWNLSTGKPVAFFGNCKLKGYISRASSGAPNQSLLACGTLDAQIAIWNKAALEHHESFLAPRKPWKVLHSHSQTVNAVTWLPCYPWFLVSASDDGTLLVWS